MARHYAISVFDGPFAIMSDSMLTIDPPGRLFPCKSQETPLFMLV
jgi:hypothetical protein